MRRSISSGFLSIFSGSVLVMFVGMVSTPVLYRLLGPAGFGRYAFVLSLFMLFMIFVSAGVGDGVRKYLSEDREEPNWDEHVVGFYLRLAILLAAAGAGLLVLAVQSGLVATVLGESFEPYFYLLAVLVLAGQFRAFTRRTLMGFGLERYSEPLNVAKKVTFAGTAIAMVWLGYGVFGALVGDLIASLLVVVVGIVPIARRLSLRAVVSRVPTDFPRDELLQFNTLSIVLVFLMTSLYHVDVIMLQPLAGSEQVGYYKAALKVAEFLWFVPLAIQTVLVHSTSELWSRERRSTISDLATRVTRYTLLLSGVMALGIAALSSEVVPLYFGPDARPAIEPLLLLLPGALGFAAARPLLAIAQGKGDLRDPILATGGAAVINVTLNLALIPTYGMVGAAVATSVGYGSMFLFHVWSARRVGFDPLSDARLGRIVLTTAIAAGPILWLSTVVEGTPLALVVVPPLGLAIYLAVAVVTGALGLMEPFDVLRSFPAPIGPTAGRVQRRIRGTFPRWEQS